MPGLYSSSLIQTDCPHALQHVVVLGRAASPSDTGLHMRRVLSVILSAPNYAVKPRRFLWTLKRHHFFFNCSSRRTSKAFLASYGLCIPILNASRHASSSARKAAMALVPSHTGS